MVHDDIPSSAPGQPSAPTSGPGHDGNTSQRHDIHVDQPEVPRAERDRLRKAGLTKKLQFMTHLMRSLDMVVFAEMSAMYYME
jgi:hypothetical protein